jgi:hypothetical protein
MGSAMVLYSKTHYKNLDYKNKRYISTSTHTTLLLYPITLRVPPSAKPTPNIQTSFLPPVSAKLAPPTILRRAPGRSGPRSSLVLRDILDCTKLILFCGPSYFGIFGKEPGNGIDGQD